MKNMPLDISVLRSEPLRRAAGLVSRAAKKAPPQEESEFRKKISSMVGEKRSAAEKGEAVRRGDTDKNVSRGHEGQGRQEIAGEKTAKTEKSCSAEKIRETEKAVSELESKIREKLEKLGADPEMLAEADLSNLSEVLNILKTLLANRSGPGGAKEEAGTPLPLLETGKELKSVFSGKSDLLTGLFEDVKKLSGLKKLLASISENEEAAFVKTDNSENILKETDLAEASAPAESASDISVKAETASEVKASAASADEGIKKQVLGKNRPSEAISSDKQKEGKDVSVTAKENIAAVESLNSKSETAGKASAEAEQKPERSQAETENPVLKHPAEESTALKALKDFASQVKGRGVAAENQVASESIRGLSTSLDSGKIVSASLPTQQAVDGFSEKQVVSQLVNRFTVTLGDSRQEMKIMLKPEHLGTVKLKLDLEGESLCAKMRVENETVKHIVENNMQTLKDALGEKGVKVQDFEVSVSSDDSSAEEREFGTGNKRGGREKLSGAVSADSGLMYELNLSGNPDTGRRYGYNSMEFVA
ncbi:MAG: flagellar hook-length control protein FliK [Fibrobacterota bacterium]